LTLLALLLIGLAILTPSIPVFADSAPASQATATRVSSMGSATTAPRTIGAAKGLPRGGADSIDGGIALASDADVDATRLGLTATAVLPDEERLLLLAFEALAAARLDTAEHHLRTLLRKFPDFHLARLTLADVFMARSGRFVDFASGAAGQRVEALRQEALARLANARDANVYARQPDALLQLSKSQSQAVVVDLKASRM